MGATLGSETTAARDRARPASCAATDGDCSLCGYHIGRLLRPLLEMAALRDASKVFTVTGS